MCKWAEPEPEEEEEVEEKEAEKRTTRRSSGQKDKESPSTTPTKGKSPSKSPVPLTKEKSPHSTTSSKRSTPEKESGGLIFSIKWADTSKDDVNEDETVETADDKIEDSQEQSEKEDSEEETDEKESEKEPEPEKEKPLFFSVKWADPDAEEEEEEEEPEKEPEPTIPAFISSSILGEIEPKAKKDEPLVKIKEELLPPIKEEPKEPIDDSKRGTILNIRWADDPADDLIEDESEPESPPRSPTPSSLPPASPAANSSVSTPLPPESDDEPYRKSSSRASSVSTRSTRSTKSDGSKGRKKPKAGPKSAMKSYRTRNSSGGTSDSSTKSTTKRKMPLAGPKSAIKKIKEEIGVDKVTEDLSSEQKSKRLRCPSQKLLEWNKANEKVKPAPRTAKKSTSKASKISTTTAKSTTNAPPVRIKTEPREQPDPEPQQPSTSSFEPVGRMKRKARPSTFNQGFNTDPNSPYLYTSSRSKGPTVRVENDVDEDNDEYTDCSYVPDMNSATDDSSEDSNHGSASKSKRSKLITTKEITPVTNTTSASRRTPASRQRPSTRRVKLEPEIVIQNESVNETGISLGSVYSLADDDIVMEPDISIHSTKPEPLVQLNVVDVDCHFLGITQQRDPLADPLSMPYAGRNSAFLRKRPAFTWPKLDPLFLIMTDFQLPRSFEPLIRAKLRPTAEILPMQKLGGVRHDSSLSISKVGSPTTTKDSGIRRSGRRKIGRFEMKNLFEGTVVDSPYSLSSFSARRPQPPSPTPPQESSEDLAVRLSKISGSSITITPYKDSKSSKSSKGSAPVQTRVVPLDRKDFPWLPRDWKVHATVDTNGIVSHSFVSPSGVSLSSQPAVMQFLKSTDLKTYHSALQQQVAAHRKKGSTPKTAAATAASAAKAKAAAAARAKMAKQKQNVKGKLQQKPVASASSPKKKVASTAEGATDANVKREPYKILCKAGEYNCPLCNTNFKLNQTYGRHMVEKKCKKQDKKSTPPKLIPNKSMPWIMEEVDIDDGTGKPKEESDLEVLQANVTKVPLHHIKVQNCTIKDDSYVDISSVPCLKLIARNKLSTGGILRVPISVKEGLEYYHSIVWKDNNENTYFEELCFKTKITSCNTVSSYEDLCKEPLKVALYLEKKISISREKFGAGHNRTKNWVQKYQHFLKLPLHDIFLSLQNHTYKVIEHYTNGEVKGMCLNCSQPICAGCALVRTPAANPDNKPAQSSPAKKIAVPIRVKSTGPPARGAAPGFTFTRCGECPGCMQPNCRRCVFCRDMKRYGGVGKIRKACMKRVCVKSTKLSSPNRLLANSSTTVMNKAAGTSVVAGGVRKLSSPTGVGGINTPNNKITYSSPMGSPMSMGSVSITPSTGSSLAQSRMTPSTSTSITTSTPNSSNALKRIPMNNSPQQRPPSPVTIDLDDPNLQSIISNSAPAATANKSTESYPCTVCKRPFPTRIQMLAHRSVSHDKTNIVASVNRPVVLHHGGEKD